ncbi:hypothetical protein BBK82_29925 [Lentzea guizhouensis]|uniref:Uncharacterized protein n=1 Tax=Lentzea guizhouensis TaxID=1586287 RepID=A0A1B2HPK3_9PSEU|nr:hypothetical protein BBK82_29925 [Lentzea guizhouensis]
MEDADEAVGKVAKGDVVWHAASALAVVVGPCLGEALSALMTWRMNESTSLVLRTYRQFTVVLRPESMATGWYRCSSYEPSSWRTGSGRHTPRL